MSDFAPSVVLQWIPEDDLLLKNAVEHGASLEALAKGAVRFSRKFSVEELRHRWYSLLYDPDISADASSRMVEMEHSACNTSSKLNRSGHSKENEDVSLKRKIESVQQLYYSMRKKTCHQPLNSAESPVYSHITGDSAAANVVFGITNAWHTHDPNSIQDDQKAILRKHDNIDFLEKDPITINSPTRKGLGHPVLGDERPKDFPHGVEGVPLNLGIGRGVQDMEHSNASPDGSVSFRIGGYLSPSPKMPLWELTDNISGPAVPVNMNVGDEDRGVGRSVVPDGVRGQGYLLHCSMEDELIYGNADGKHTADKSCYDSLDSLLSTS
ncbi:hypothetical protein HS088_TW14G00115 [Tripterygium wilfordii]|uniref:Microspherule protein N-terminal domain-containing protein n=1 Tax=Tripterygium wilfordii TaxID=458696 RepID=A0A7J7CPG5_TRIWF|nr:hypothetical protein HS088_TW14G00115 [Tripterygium wilfordii]